MRPRTLGRSGLHFRMIHTFKISLCDHLKASFKTNSALEAKPWDEGSTAPDDDRKYFQCLPEFGFFNYFSGLLMCAAHQRISVDSNELVSRSEPTILNKQGERHSIEKGYFCPKPPPAT